MKKPIPSMALWAFISLLLVIINTDIAAQAPLEKDVLIVSCRTGTLLIDGIEIGRIESDDASRQKLTYGEHYLQVRSENEKINLTISVDSSLKGIIKMGCSTSDEALAKKIRVLNKKINLSGLIINETEDNLISFDKGDEVVINYSILNKKGTGTILIKNYETGTEIYKKENVSNIIDGRIKIPTRGVYQLSLSTEALFGKDAEVTIDRIPGQGSSVDFNTTPKKVYDTTSIEVLNTKVRVYSTTNVSNSNRTILTINLPKNTSYWVYWIGVGQESMEKMREFASGISNIGSTFTLNPLVKFGFKLIPSLPMFHSSATVDYRFLDNANSQLFMSKQGYRRYTFRNATNITTDYALVNGYTPDLVLAFNNDHISIGNDVEVKVVAFSVESRMTID